MKSGFPKNKGELFLYYHFWAEIKYDVTLHFLGLNASKEINIMAMTSYST
jgi:hypothetical protein